MFYDDRTELLSVQKYEWENSFTIEISTVYPNRAGKENLCLNLDKELDELNVWNTQVRYRIKGTFDGWFYYTDLYSKWIPFFKKDYLAVSETKKPDIHRQRGTSSDRR